MWPALLASVALVALSPPARAAGPIPADLRYVADAAAGCPDEQAFRDVVAERMGRDPFTGGALTVEAGLQREAAGLVGTVRAIGSGGVVGERRIEAARGECPALAGSLAIAISILLDPFALGAAPAPAPETLPEPPPPEPPPDPPVASAAVEPEPTPDLALHGDLSASTGLAPGTTWGPALGIGLRIDRYWLALEGRLDATAPSADRALDATVITGGPVGCAALGLGIACIAAHFGAFQGRRIDPGADLQTSFFSAADARGGLQIALGDRLALRALAELRVPLVRTALVVDGETAWRAPPVAIGLRIGLAAAL